jgi:hypothetical protein
MISMLELKGFSFSASFSSSGIHALKSIEKVSKEKENYVSPKKNNHFHNIIKII